MRTLFNSKQNIAWQGSVQAKLDLLTESQVQIREELAELVKAQRPTPIGRQRAITFLFFFLIVIWVAVTATILSPAFQGRASTAANQAQTAAEQEAKVFQPIQNIVRKYGAEYLVTHANQSLLSDLKAADSQGQLVAKYTAEANDYTNAAVGTEYLGGIILATGSACFGAIAGWLLIPLLVGRPSRRRKKGRPSTS